MPRHYRKKRSPRTKRKLIRRGRQSIARGLNNPAIMHFKRKRHVVVSVGTAGQGWLLNGTQTMYKTFDFRLDDLADTADFVNLFKFYKINAVAVKIWPCNSFTGENAYTGQFTNSQLLVRWDQNLDGIASGASAGEQSTYQTSQTAKVKRLISGQANPVTLYMKLRQSNMVYKALGPEVPPSNTGYTLMRPRWTSTSDLGVAHYGLNCCIHRMSDDSLSQGFNNQQKLRIEYTYYISCKKVQ